MQCVVKNILIISFFATQCVCVCVCVCVYVMFVCQATDITIIYSLRKYLHSWGREVVATRGGHRTKCVAEEEATQKGVHYGTEVKESDGKIRDVPRVDLVALFPAFGQRRIQPIMDISTSL